MQKIWFITGASRGFGLRFAQAALSRGDKVAATARHPDALAALVTEYGDNVLPIALDVTDKPAATGAVQQAHAHFGRLDVVVNNAGYGACGAVEELTEQDVRAQFETNVFGSLWVTQAALPYLREQRSGHIFMLSSLLGLAAFPTTGAYSGSKAAIEAIADALAQEVAGFGIKVTVVEPGPFGTDFANSSTRAQRLPPYEPVHDAVNASFASMPMADPAIVGPALLQLVDAQTPPLRVFFGPLAAQVVPHVYAERLRTWEAWAHVGV
ncbi:SDR family NAD(P)-dependent oxidoreductase [Xanthomonas vesicatoria]|uniref:SDR family NAD(P)-dependent oxidoreductase n=1 Tax=Xanthomonas vesicatoria TaxID=56460 RepID=UPI000731FAC4|nr:SDR family NAD(P)-dependent oxidoreductase [Xanthomonas vesicatoria]KTF38156.1 short-chain dehydrogenase [Xanthomonas vesicatoria]MCC8560383.1 SDR family NAD(P)-dependent oxidoreductase [Xanthomonas vesicatoria]MCC8601344.1 SDR family NAD(P)-dependent oxidoreductase [Xanthomonas vesicatoria]MCC8610695.1 SDR family NAD(P)-dependent oxidoreductase [Xanthomonas vesicatoria]MCC8673158.1 SDR family NAD(P)-dependent oxidoreductase [Xanthomonas vesicatoria]